MYNLSNVVSWTSDKSLNLGKSLSDVEMMFYPSLNSLSQNVAVSASKVFKGIVTLLVHGIKR